ncbi:SusD/RagB family nutrient-binding outer membrane lipoprotein [Parabacteroides bouchesdurhonensis]|uniref:SusD/RagB family nutrient-binding outer membrane lipoprotein n=1 Tax=Parabacteroides bouchesdurhonensis TaxID=1936995 RepID=UPI000E4E93A8|nr:SusD/RagB family nutrient-binding outer membrane lipoprotein [Parabacteroides bouchesdurhonensis]RHJ90840.1 SusD/RagB family nutrient-binding outer membrane lipoprotein [Bacteroides sp. AM07-16]
MKTNIFKQIKSTLPLWIMATMVGGTACTSDFETINTDPNGIPAEEVSLEARFSQPITSVYLNYQNRNYEYQLQQNLNADLYSGYMANPTPFGGNNNNSTYAMNDGWNETSFKAGELYVMKPISIILESTSEPDFVSIAKIIRVEGMHRVADTYGPVPYSQAMKGGTDIPYDDLKTLYETFIKELNESVDALTSFVDEGKASASRLQKFDIVCGADHKQWIRFANTLRLRLAMRIAMVEPELAKTTAEAAVNHKYGVLVAGNNDVEVVDPTLQNPLQEINYAYGDIRVGASIVSLLQGYNDPRLPKYVRPVGWFVEKGAAVDIKDESNKPTGNIGKYIGIRQGIIIPDKSNYVMYSTLNMPSVSKNTDQNGNQEQITNALPWMKVAEAYFLRAEGALRGWNMGGSAKELYEQGIKVSFDEYGISAADYNAYINDDKSVAADYVDPFNSENNIKGLDKCTVKWDEAASREDKLHKIINQKWLAMYPEGQEAWSEFRRTGYPKLFPVAENRSGTVNGGIEDGDFVKRLRFPRNDRNTNAAEVKKAVSLLSGPDNEATRLWWDTGRNF